MGAHRHVIGRTAWKRARKRKESIRGEGQEGTVGAKRHAGTGVQSGNDAPHRGTVDTVNRDIADGVTDAVDRSVAVGDTAGLPYGLRENCNVVSIVAGNRLGKRKRLIATDGEIVSVVVLQGQTQA